MSGGVTSTAAGPARLSTSTQDLITITLSLWTVLGVFIDGWSAAGKAAGQNSPAKTDALFLVTPCPTDIIDKGSGG